MSLYNVFGTNQEAETNGTWVEFPKNDDGTVPGFLVTFMGRTNTDYQKAIERVGKRLKRDIELDLLDNETAQPIMREVFLSTILKDWRNVQDAKGKVIPYSKDAATKLFNDLPHLYDYLASKAKALATFRDIEVEEAAGK